MPSLPEYDVTIIGAGAVGAACARELSRYRLKVLLLEKEADVGFGTSKANSGIVHSGIHDHPGTLKARFCMAGNRLYPFLAAELDVLYKQNGMLIIAGSPSELPELERLRQNGLQNGVPQMIMLSREELLDLEPNLAPTLAGGLLVPSGGVVSPFDLVYALTENAVANGVSLRVGAAVTGISTQKDGFLVRTGQGELKTGYIINAAGLGSQQIAALIGDDSVTIEARKGEEYLLDRRLDGLVKRTIFPLPTPASKGILVIPTVDGNTMIGPTSHPVQSLTDLSTTPSGWQEIYQNVIGLVPSLRPSDLITSFAGLRASSQHGEFIIGPSPLTPRLIHAAGIQSPGLTAAPGIAQYLVTLLSEAGLALKPKRNFNPERRLIRLRNLPREQQATLMRQNPAYAHIVCRCEMVSEAEVREAIRRGATTLDGIKLRTRTGMGRCQGGFCTPKLIQIMSQELKMPPAALTKNGPGSMLLTGWIRKEAEHND